MAGGNDELRAKENKLEKEIEQAKLAAGGETPLPSPERQATIEAPFEDIVTCFSFMLCLHGFFSVVVTFSFFGSCFMLGPDPKTG